MAKITIRFEYNSFRDYWEIREYLGLYAFRIRGTVSYYVPWFGPKGWKVTYFDGPDKPRWEEMPYSLTLQDAFDKAERCLKSPLCQLR